MRGHIVFQALQIGRGTLRRGVAAVQKRMHHDFGHARGHGGIEYGKKVLDVAVHAAIGKQPQQMHGFIGHLPGGGEGGVGGEAAVFHGHVDAGDVLRHHAPGADV